MLYEYNHQAVRDLAWIIASPPLIDHEKLWDEDFFLHEYKRCKSWLEKLDKAPQALKNHLSQQTRKNLGSYFESLVSFWLEYRDNTKILAQNLQVKGTDKTLGEFDFLLEINGNKVHLEVAVKFYLAIENSTNWNCWVGVNKQDRLDIKLNKMLDTQMELSHTAEGKQAMETAGIDSSDISSLGLFKGYFFNNAATTTHKWPERHCNGFNHAYWYHLDQLNEVQGYDELCILNKPYWLSGSNVADGLDYSDFKKSVSATIKAGRSVLCSGINRNGIESRFFVVDNEW